MSDQYRHYYGYCDECGVIVHAEVGPDAGPDDTLPPDEEWEGFGLTCPVCNDTVPGRFEGADNRTTEDVRGELLTQKHRALAVLATYGENPEPSTTDFEFLVSQVSAALTTKVAAS